MFRQQKQHTMYTLFAGTSSKEQLGRSTWTFLHTLAAQYPEQPTRAQKRDTVQLVCILEVTSGSHALRMHRYTDIMKQSMLCQTAHEFAD
jgi:hypothetical protein